MKFIVTSTSGRHYDCIQEDLERIKYKRKKYRGEGWIEDHNDVMVTEINTLEELLEIVDKVDREYMKRNGCDDFRTDGIIIGRLWADPQYPTLEIYDDYRE